MGCIQCLRFWAVVAAIAVAMILVNLWRKDGTI